MNIINKIYMIMIVCVQDYYYNVRVALVLNHKRNDKSLVGYIFNKYIPNQHLHNNTILTVD